MKNVKMEKIMIRSRLLLSVMIWLAPVMVIAQPHLILDSAESDQLTQTLIEKTQAMLLAMDTYSRTGNADFGNDAGVSDIRTILETRELRISRDTLYSQVIRVGSGGFELRQLFMQYGQAAHEFVELVARFGLQGELLGVEIANELQNFNRVLSRASPADEVDRQRVEQVLEEFAAAFTNKDAQGLATYFDQNALVISGSVRNNQTIFTRTDRDAYLQRMASTIFPNNERVQVTFDQIEVFINPGYRNVFGVSLYQYWTTSNYSDEGHLALMVDLRDAENPRILIRFWQPNPFELGRAGQFEPEPLSMAIVQGEFTPSDFAYLNVTVHTNNPAVLNADILKNWIENEIFEVSGLTLDADAAEIVSQSELRVPFVTENENVNYEDLELFIFDTALLSSLRSEIRIIPGYGHQLDLYVFKDDDEEVPAATKPFADIMIEGNPQGAQVSLKRLADSTMVVDQILENESLFQRVQPGKYQFRAEQEGFESYETSLSLDEGTMQTIRFALDRIPAPPVVLAPKESDEFEEEAKAGFYTRNRMLVWAAVAATTASAALLLMIDGSSSGSDPAFFPPPPGRP